MFELPYPKARTVTNGPKILLILIIAVNILKYLPLFFYYKKNVFRYLPCIT